MTEVRSTVVVVTWRGRDHLAACLDALAAQDCPHKTLVVDNASGDGSAEILAAHPSRPEMLRLPENRGYAGGLAAALPQVRTPFVAWLNDDAAPEPGWLRALENALVDGVAAVSPVLTTPGGDVQSTGVRLTADGHGADTQVSGEVFGFCGGAALLRTSDLRAVGGIPSEFFCYYEDTDTAWRLRLAGRRIVSAPQARATHLHGASTRPGSARFHHWNERNRLLMLLRCAPSAVAAREVARFAAITFALPLRALVSGKPGSRPHRRSRPHAANFRVTVRLRALAAVAFRLVPALRARRRIRLISTVPRHVVWREWHGQ